MVNSKPRSILGWRGFGLAITLVGCALFAVSSPTAAAPDEERLGKSSGYPIGTPETWFFDERVRVGSFSHLDRIFPHATLKRAPRPLPLPTAENPPVIRYAFQGQTLGIGDFLARQRITGLLILKDGQIVAEHYQYDRTAAHRLVSQSMAKSITSLAVGFALADGKIRSLDDRAAVYVPELKGTGYGETTLRNLLRMSSGIRFSEMYDGKDDSRRLGVKRATAGTVAALREFSEREAPQGTRFHYATSETITLLAVVRRAIGGSVSDYLTQRLWKPMGAEADATWITGRVDGYENGGGRFNAVLRDYGRLGVLLANDGLIDGRQVIPKDYLLEATDWRKHAEAFRPGKATSYFGYGYQFWTFPGDKRRFALLGVYGQSIFVDPELKLVMVITAVAREALVGQGTLAAERSALWRALIAAYEKKR